MSAESTTARLPPRAEIALLTLQLRGVHQEIEAAEAALADDSDAALTELRGRLGPLLDDRRAALAADVEQARLRADAAVEAARADAAAIVAAARPPVVAELPPVESPDVADQPVDAPDVAELPDVADVPVAVDALASDAPAVDAAWFEPVAADTDLPATGPEATGLPVFAFDSIVPPGEDDPADAADLTWMPTDTLVDGAPTTEPAVDTESAVDVDRDVVAGPAPDASPADADADAAVEADADVDVATPAAPGAAEPHAAWNDTAVVPLDWGPIEPTDVDDLFRPGGGQRAADDATRPITVTIDAEAFAAAIAAVVGPLMEQRPASPYPAGHSFVVPVAPPKRSFWSHAWHADVLLSALAMVMVLVVLLAWTA